MPAKRIAFVDHAEQLGGAQKSLIELLGNLDRARYEPVLLCAKKADWLERADLNGVEKVRVFESSEVLGWRRDRLANSWIQSVGVVSRALGPVSNLISALRQVRPDLVHTNTLKAHMLGSAAAKLLGLPLVWHVRDILEPGGALTWLIRAGRWSKPRVIAISNAVRDQFEGCNIDVEVIYNGIPLDRFAPGPADEALRDEFGITSGARVITVVGRLTPWKGHRVLLEALNLILPEYPDAVLIVVGEVAFWETDYLGELQGYAQELGVAQAVRWLGFRDDVAEILALTDVFALPSENEPFGRAIIEAMAAGKPVVATRSGGVPEIVVDGETGLLVEPRSKTQLAQAICQLLGDTQMAARMGQAGLERAKRSFDTHRVAETVQALYDRTLRARMSRASRR
ncbi:MAG: glycosyltransferase family 4 protein [Armatimonadetes bacterium]|nr:glycosyltransferase family 4 protein [Armatimonadota bacterium]